MSGRRYCQHFRLLHHQAQHGGGTPKERFRNQRLHARCWMHTAGQHYADAPSEDIPLVSLFCHLPAFTANVFGPAQATLRAEALVTDKTKLNTSLQLEK
jgi:hypothetical protein